MLTDITLEKMVEGLKSILEGVKVEMGVDDEITEKTFPLAIFKSDVLVTLIGRLEDVLNIKIPHNCYPFFDKEKFEQLTIKQAAEILINKATNDR